MADIKFISGEGKPRLIKVSATGVSTYSGGTFTTTTASATNLGTKARVNQRVSSYKVVSGFPDKLVWGKITAIVNANSVALDAWVGGTPTNASPVSIDGWVIDLPYCDDKNLVETFTPDMLVHNLYRSRKETKFFGWGYEAKLSYEDYISADVLLSLRPALNMLENDRLILCPRSDRLQRNYNVYYGGAIKLARQVEEGHKLVSFVFKGNENVQFPIPNSGWGFHYGGAFGSTSH